MKPDHPSAPPWGSIQCVFLDVGNTLLSVDFAWVSRELRTRGLACEATDLERAEAAARPRLSSVIAADRSTEGHDSFRTYLRLVLTQLPDAARDDAALDAIADELIPVLRTPGRSDLLWNRVMSGVPPTLEALRAAGLRLVVVSNADGTVRQNLRDRGLDHHFDVIIDSQEVGFEKPDPRIFAHALEASGASPETTLHVGDLHAADVVGARAVGIHPVLLDPYDDWGPQDCVRLTDVGALVPLLANAR